jgi:hypothetical protein
MAGLLLGLAAWPTVVAASGDGGCEAAWTLAATEAGCASRIVIGPGNDTRANLLLLVRDRAGLDGQGLSYFEDEWLITQNGHTFFDWNQLVATLHPAEAAARDPFAERGEFEGTRCQSVTTGGAQFLAAARRNRRVGARDRAALAEGREALVRLCVAQSGYRPYRERDAEPVSLAPRDLPHSFASPEAREFGTYLAGAAAFYLGDWRAARLQFVALRAARDAWVRETALYMIARNELGAAAASGMSEWGYFERQESDRALAARAEEALQAYLDAYPAGRYAASARGLTRRARWLGGADGKQGAAYARMLAAVDPATPDVVELVDEIDDKFLLEIDAAQAATAGPWVLAAHDLWRMRYSGDAEGWRPESVEALTAAELAGQEAAFARHPGLFEFLEANFAFYVARDYRAVLDLLPDDARRAEYSPLAFSRQVLRGMALAELDDRNEAGFWQQLLGGAKGPYQRPTVELGLALDWERSGQVAKIFAAGSPIEDERIRSLLLTHAAGPEVLRAVAGATDRPPRERDLAAFVLLYKELSRASYAAAARDFALVRGDATGEGWFYWDVSESKEIPVGLFTRGVFSDQYACPPLRETAASLARHPRDVKARLCLGDFYRLNGFDNIRIDDAQPAGELGSFAEYPGAPIPRSRFYSDIIGEVGVPRDERAYALYRAIRCYAPGGTSSCGGEEVPLAQRIAWFRRLKGEFGNTRWGRQAKYYW